MPSMPRKVDANALRVAIVGGSMGGLTTALLLRTLGHDGGVAMHGRAIEHAVCRDCVLPLRAHRVRVTFCRWRGSSTSVPRKAARRITKA